VEEEKYGPPFLTYWEVFVLFLGFGELAADMCAGEAACRSSANQHEHALILFLLAPGT
jgi:hypothetical protein